MNRRELTRRKGAIQRELRQRRKRVHFGTMGPGSHEMDSGVAAEAEHNKFRMAELERELRQIKTQLG